MSDVYTGSMTDAGNGTAQEHGQTVQDAQASVLESADEMILANGQAEALEIRDLKAVADQYQSQIEELKSIYSNTSQQQEALQQRYTQMMKSNAQTLSRIQDLLEDLSRKAEADKQLDWSALKKHVDDASYDAGRRTTEAVNSTSESILEAVSGAQDKIADLIQQSDDFSHKENVRVYRNVQAATDQLLAKQTQELRVDINAQKDAAGRSKPSGVSIAALVVALITLAYVVCDSLGVIGLLQQLMIR